MNVQSDRNAKFWVHWNDGWVKIKLKPMQELRAHRYRDTDEGYSLYEEEWFHEGRNVECKITTESVDCDGRMSHHWFGICGVNNLMSINAYDDYECPENIGIMKPDWIQLSRSQRDYTAEADGY